MPVYVYNHGLVADRTLTPAEKDALIAAYCGFVERELDARGFHRSVRWDPAGAQAQRLDPALAAALDEIEGEDGIDAIEAAVRAVSGG
jgi:hypothetical protein